MKDAWKKWKHNPLAGRYYLTDLSMEYIENFKLNIKKINPIYLVGQKMWAVCIDIILTKFIVR